MWNYFSEARVQQLSVFWSAVIIVGLFMSTWVRVWPSIGIAGLFLTGVGYRLGRRKIAQRAHGPELLGFLLVYAVHAITGFLHTNLTDKLLRQDLVLQLPFVLLPLAFWLLPAWKPRQLQLLWLLLLGCCLVAAGGATANYLTHNKEIESLYLQSKVMPTEPDHIRFSLLVSIAIVAGVVLIFSRQLPRFWERTTAVAVVLLFLFQHLLAVRSGIVTMYSAGIVWLLWVGYHQRRWKTTFIGTALIVGLGAGCLLAFPTLQNKIINTRTDASQFDSVEAANNYSIVARIYSYQAAWAIIRQHPLLGVSKVRLADEMAQQYSRRFPAIDSNRYVLPHNQFLYNLAAYGVIGLALFVLGYYYLLWKSLGRQNILLGLIYLIVSISFLAEYTLESNIGVIVGLFFMLLAAAPTVPPGKPLAASADVS
jgi:O-antigen ligase